MYLRFFKRPFDIAVSAIALVLLSPIFAGLSVAVRFRLGAPVLFRQVRPGRCTKPFELIKFRTMIPPEPSSSMYSDAGRIPPFGQFLRSTSLDELPELLNVLRGDMSLVGPRPLLTEYLDLYTPREEVRHSVRPGITGLAQVSGRNLLSWDARLELDANYVENISFLGDVRVLAKTFMTTLHRTGITDGESESQTDLREVRRQEDSC